MIFDGQYSQDPEACGQTQSVTKTFQQSAVFTFPCCAPVWVVLLVRRQRYPRVRQHESYLYMPRKYLFRTVCHMWGRP